MGRSELDGHLIFYKTLFIRNGATFTILDKIVQIKRHV